MAVTGLTYVGYQWTVSVLFASGNIPCKPSIPWSVGGKRQSTSFTPYEFYICLAKGTRAIFLFVRSVFSYIKCVQLLTEWPERMPVCLAVMLFDISYGEFCTKRDSMNIYIFLVLYGCVLVLSEGDNNDVGKGYFTEKTNDWFSWFRWIK